MLKPAQVNISGPFFGSAWKSCETEIVARNIVVFQQKLDGSKWTPFTWEQYKAGCEHTVTESERGVLEALTNGGRPVTFTTAFPKPGYLTKNERGEYSVTQKFIDALPQKTCLAVAFDEKGPGVHMAL